MVRSRLLFIFLILPTLVYANDDESRTHPKKQIMALRVLEEIRIDGYLNEPIWLSQGITGFIQRDPVEGEAATQKTVVWVAYDDDAIYIAARLQDTSPDSIVARLGRRDVMTSSDRFTVRLDPWHDHRTGFYFRINAAGAFSDGVLQNDDWSDDSWDGVRESAATIDDQGWMLGMRIPYSQLRFPEKDITSEFNFGDATSDLWDADGDNIILVKIAYWWTP